MADTAKILVDKWTIYPDILESKKFIGYNTRDDITELKGGFPIGQNIVFTDGGKPTLRPGYEPVGAENLSAETPITRAWRFERRDGVEIELRSYDDELEYMIDGVMTDWKRLKNGFTVNKKFTFAVLSKATNINSEIRFCNGVEDWYVWTGVYGLVASFDDTAHTLTLQGTTTLANLGFPASGTVIVNGVEITYTSIATQVFSGCSAMSGIVAGDICTASPTVESGLANFKSSVGIAHDGRIHARLETKQSVSDYSKLDNPSDWSAGATDGDGGAKELEGGGPITAYARDEQKLYIFKKRTIKSLEYTQVGTRVDVPKWATLKPGDDKSTTVGAVGDKSTFHAPNAIIFVTEDKEMLMLKRQEYLDYPQQISLSDPIKPTFLKGVHDDASGIVYKSKIWYAYKQDENSTYNDTVIIYDLIRNRWFTPIIGWNVSDWTVINNELHWHSSITPNTYKVIDDKTDNTQAFTSVLRTHSEDFGLPNWQKNVGELLLELYMTENTEIQLNILYDEDGYTENVMTTIKGTDTGNIINSQSYNPFGASAFGTEQFGSNANISGMKKYRYIIPLKANNEFYNIALQLTTVGAGMNYELIRYGYRLDDVFKLNSKLFIFKI